MSERETRCWDHAHGSLSQDRAFDACQYRWDAQYRRRAVRDGLGAPAIVGLAVDSWLTDAVMGVEPPDIRDILSATAIEIGKPDDQLDWKYMEAKSKALIEVALRDMVPTYEGKVIATQVEVHFKVPGIEREYHAHLDLVVETPSGGVGVIDWKTSERRLNEDRAVADQQLTRYALALREAPEWGIMPDMVGLDGLIYYKSRNEALYDPQRSTRTKEQLDSHVREMQRREAVRGLIELGTIEPLTNGRSSLYECNNCPARPICPAWEAFADARANG